MKTLLAKLVAPLALLALSATAQASLVTNGDFSSGGTGWTVTPALVGSYFNFSGGQANFGALSSYDDEISQTISTVVGQTYQITFDLITSGGANNDFSAAFGGTTGYSEVNASHSLQTISFFAVASSTQTLLAFFGRNGPSWDYLDNVSVSLVNDVSAVPLPASAYLMLSALGVIGFLATRRGSKSTGAMNFA